MKSNTIVDDDPLSKSGEGASSVEVIGSIQGVISSLEELDTFICSEAESHSFAQNPHIILAECRRNPSLQPYLIIFRKDTVIRSVATGLFGRQSFNLSFSIFSIPISQRHVLTLMGAGLICRKNYVRNEELRNFFSFLWQERKRIDVIALHEIELTSPLWRFMRDDLTSLFPSFLLTLASSKEEIISRHELLASYDDWYRSLRAKTRKRISWEKNRFRKRAPQPIELFTVRSENDVPCFMNHVQTIRKNSWQGKTISRSDMDPDGDIRFFQEIAGKGWLRSYLLLCAGQPVAYELAAQYNKELTFLERGYDQHFQSIAPGTYLTYHIMEDCYSNDPPQVINFGFGENEFKKRLRTGTQPACYAYLTRPGLSRVLVRSQQGLNILENSVSGILKKINLDHRVRKFLKRKK